VVLNLHSGDDQEVGEVDPHRELKEVEEVGEMTNNVDNDGGEAVSEHGAYQASSKCNSDHNEGSLWNHKYLFNCQI